MSKQEKYAGLIERLLKRAEAIELRSGWNNDASLLSEAADALASRDAALSVSDGKPAQARGWQPQAIETAPKDGTPVLLRLKCPIPEPGRDDLRSIDGVAFVGRHPGIYEDGFDFGWNFAAPVGYGGIPDAWIECWYELPTAPAKREETKE
jgi:hypothetical protein